MNVVKFISAEKLDEYIRTEVAERLRANDIRDLDSYAWVGEATIDREYFGHSEHPLGWDFAFANTSFGRPLSRSLESWEEQLSVSYDDFDALMGSARLAIGLALFYGDLLKQNVFADQSLFEHHSSGAILILAMTSDRLRDCFISAVLNKTTEEYQAGRYKNQNRTWYVTPFSYQLHITVT
jgi:hypothetical protein